MKRSITRLGMSLGAAALLALGAACSRDSRPAQQPNQGTTSPTFESNVPQSEPGQTGAEPDQGMSGQQGQQGQQGAMGQQGQQGAMGQQGQQGQQGAMGEPQSTPAPTASQSEREVCDTLASGAKLHVEDVQNGVAIVATPRAGSNLSTVRDDAQRFDRMMHQGAGGPQAGGAGASESCGLFSLGRLPSVTTTVTEGGNSVRIVMTTSNPGEVRDLRRIARDQINTINKSTPGAPQRGGHQGGHQGGQQGGQQGSPQGGHESGQKPR